MGPGFLGSLSLAMGSEAFGAILASTTGGTAPLAGQSDYGYGPAGGGGVSGSIRSGSDSAVVHFGNQDPAQRPGCALGLGEGSRLLFAMKQHAGVAVVHASCASALNQPPESPRQPAAAVDDQQECAHTRQSGVPGAELPAASTAQVHVPLVSVASAGLKVVGVAPGVAPDALPPVVQVERIPVVPLSQLLTNNRAPC